MTILIIEDNPINTKLVRDLLQAGGYTTLEAQDASTGLEIARREKPDLILMDIQLPGMDGLEATRILKADPATAGIPVLAVTAYAMKGDAEKALDAGCDGYVTKPIEIHHFIKKVRSLLTF
ncbi:response regulator [Desulfotomaculum copahuensis]|uniref:Stage 0 sporulation protein A homolog n=1 Tax=Desulfotomaculum copahuensis TaxID=1838280 RepID=A0A1B7LGP1_9FIRM|nr:response regulator [Desulfotomaculum copahuensis]OAT85179.1 two-component system response regulator [Desulfotomaculum copahuensis]